MLALRDMPEQMNWYDAVKLGIPTKEEWMAIAENLDAVNAALVRAGGEPLKKDWYWSSSEKGGIWVWYSDIDGSCDLYDSASKKLHYYVRQAIIL